MKITHSCMHIYIHICNYIYYLHISDACICYAHSIRRYLIHMYISIYTCICTYTYLCAYTYAYIYIYIYTHTYTYVHIPLCVYICIETEAFRKVDLGEFLLQLKGKTWDLAEVSGSRSEPPVAGTNHGRASKNTAPNAFHSLLGAEDGGLPGQEASRRVTDSAALASDRRGEPVVKLITGLLAGFRSRPLLVLFVRRLCFDWTIVRVDGCLKIFHGLSGLLRVDI